jgi:hypothetical protein
MAIERVAIDSLDTLKTFDLVATAEVTVAVAAATAPPLISKNPTDIEGKDGKTMLRTPDVVAGK